MSTSTGIDSGENGSASAVGEPEPRAEGCCGLGELDRDYSCPCASMLARHRFAAFFILALIAIAVLVAEVGGVLGILAFFRAT